MNTENKKVESVSTIPYQFTAIPTNLFILLDVNCRSMLFTLFQLSSYYANKQGFFFRTNYDLQQESDLSQKLVNATIDTLYCAGIIDVVSIGKAKGKQSNHFRIKMQKVIEFEKYSMEELKNPELRISTVNYREKGYSPRYLQKTSQDNPQCLPTISPITNNKENIENKESKENSNTLYINEIREIEKKINPSISTTLLSESSKSKNVEIVEDNSIPTIDITVASIEDRNEKSRAKVAELLDANYSTKEILIQLAKTDWESYIYYKTTLKKKIRDEYIAHRELIEELNTLQVAS